MNPSSLPKQYFDLFQQQLNACQIPDAKEHAEIKKSLNRQIKQCIRELKECADTEAPEVWYALGHASTFYDKNPTKATEWYQRAADAGHIKAITKMGNQLRLSNNPNEQQQSLTWLIKASEQGDHYAMLSVGIAYRDGKGANKDLPKSAHWLKQAHEAGEPTAMELLADLHLNHLHSPANALPCYQHAHANGHHCDEALAQIYNTRGSGVYDPTKAKEHYETLLRKGQKSAPWVMLELAKLHASGQVSENGLTHARKWIYQIISQCPKSMSVRKKAERLLEKLDESLF